MTRLKFKSAIILLLFFSLKANAGYNDWPMWRYNFGRSASTPEQLADNLYLQWEVRYSPRIPVWDDPLNQNLMQYDRIFEPIVAGNKLFIGFNDKDKVLALDLNTGKELWHYYADGPVRLPLAAAKGKLYFTSDDGYCYCLDQENGSVIWKLMLAPAGNKLLGNKRLISMWPARGGIVIKDNVIYTAASIFPLMGTFIYAINADDGSIIWKNDGTGSNYILQPHNSPAFADVAPQGTFTISGKMLLVAGGRTVPAAFDLETGKEIYYQLAASGKTGGGFTCSNDKVFFNHNRERMTWMFDSETGNRIMTDAGEYPVIDGDTIYFSGNTVKAAVLNSSNRLDSLWKAQIPATNDLIKAGKYLYAADSSGINVIRLNGSNMPDLIRRYPTEKTVERLIAANGKLIAVTGDGTIQVFGDMPAEHTNSYSGNEISLSGQFPSADKIIGLTGAADGYGLIFGTRDIDLIKGLLSKTSLSIIAFDKDPERVNLLRDYFDNIGVSADRLCILNYNNSFSILPKYFSTLTIVNDISILDDFDKDILSSLYESTRPYGGKIIVKAGRNKQRNLDRILEDLNLYGAELVPGKKYALITKHGSLSGTDSWTHNYGDVANTLKSDDISVKAPLGILWFGGNSNLDVLPRHGHGPGEQVIDGHLIIEGMSGISARDVYTGRVLWKREFPRLIDDTWMVYYDETYDGESPLDTKYNQVHLPGSNARGTNFIATKEYVYLIEEDKCHLIDIMTGDLVKTFTTGDDRTRELGYIGVYQDLLILGSNFAEYPGLESDSLAIKDPKFTDFGLSASRELVVLNRFTGEKLWSIPANFGFIHNSVIAGDGILFCLDKLPQYLETKLKRRGEKPPEGSRLLYLDIMTGKKIHEETDDIFGTWLGFSSEHNLLLQATRPSSDMLRGEEGTRMVVYNTISKEKVWDKEMKYINPPIIHNDRIYSNGAGWSLLTGDPVTEIDPVTGEELNWSFKREYGCGIVAGSEHLLTFRSASAGFVNLDVFEGTGSLGGWKPSCSTNLIVADGVLNSPDYTRTCQCPYQNQTSLALVYMPWMTYWTNSNYIWSGSRIKQLGLNLNAPGDRTSEKDVLWIDYPNAGGTPSNIPVKIDTSGYYTIRKDPVTMNSGGTSWISASAVGGLRSLEITLSDSEDETECSYRLNLYFSELENKRPGDRVFNIRVQDKTVLENFDIAEETGKADKEIIKSFPGIKAGNKLKIDLVPVLGNTILSGIELIQENIAIK